MNNCKECGSYAINHHCHGRDGADNDLCDVCYWRKRYDELMRALHDAATSLETIQLRSFGDDSCLDSKAEMRSYAASRARVARNDIARIERKCQKP